MIAFWVVFAFGMGMGAGVIVTAYVAKHSDAWRDP